MTPLMTLRPLFVTQLYEASLAADKGFEAFNAELHDTCQMIAADDRAGQAWAKEHGYRGYTSYASLDDLPRRASIFSDLKKKLDKHAAAFAADLNFELGGGKLVMDSLWINILKPGGSHSGHIHPHSVLSGTVYVATPPGSSALKLEDPRLQLMMAAPPRRTNAPEIQKAFVYVAPQAGTVLMWESWLRHEVPANAASPRQGGGERMSISFNYAWR
jgi:uncharacterized protein (TIGR02466 family)